MRYTYWVFLLSSLSIISLIALIKTISKIIKLYQNPNQVVVSATAESHIFELKQIGFYEIAVKRPGLFTAIPTQVSFRLTDLVNKQEIPVQQKFNLFSQRKNGSGTRIVPVAEFQIKQTGRYRLDHLNTAEFKSKDRLLIIPKTGFKGFLLIFALVIFGSLFIGSLVLSLILISQNK